MKQAGIRCEFSTQKRFKNTLAPWTSFEIAIKSRYAEKQKLNTSKDDDHLD